MVAVATDIQAQRLAAERLQESEERFRGAIEYSALGFALVSLDGHWFEGEPGVMRNRWLYRSGIAEAYFSGNHPSRRFGGRI